MRTCCFIAGTWPGALCFEQCADSDSYASCFNSEFQFKSVVCSKVFHLHLDFSSLPEVEDLPELRDAILGALLGLCSHHVAFRRWRCVERGHRNTIPGWWFGTFFIFPYIGKNHPN